MEDEISKSSRRSTPLITGIIAILIIAGVAGAVLLRSPQTSRTVTESTTTPILTNQTSPTNAQVEQNGISGPITDSSSTGAASKSTNRVFNLTSSNFEFDQSEIRVKKGDMVTIMLNNKDGTHNWTIDEFNARTKQLQVNQTDTISFVASKKGTFEYYCSVGNHRQRGMVGKLIVE